MDLDWQKNLGKTNRIIRIHRVIAAGISISRGDYRFRAVIALLFALLLLIEAKFAY